MSSVVDQPYKPNPEDPDVKESLGTGVYAQALATFIENCQTPLTVGIQGEWGSGKTSILNMIREQLNQEDENPKSKSYYKVIWINTWEHSVLKKPEETLISIINEIIDTVSAIDGKWSSAAKAKQALQGVVKGAARIGVSYVAGAAAAEAVQEGFDGSNSIKKLRETLREILNETALARGGSSNTKFVIFIDDLDRLDPPVAVQVLELLKNIFDLEKCVFVLAIDYQVVVKGLRDKFGEPTEENEWEFRAFFDKIIQLPFMMPMASYDLTSYIDGLLRPIKFLDGQTLNSIRKKGDDSWLTNIVRSCIGYNPRSMKRLTNSLSMVGLLADMPEFKKKAPNFGETNLKNLTLSLVCLQIAFPKIFELLLKRPDFITGWDDDFMKSVTRPHFSEELHKEAVDAFNAAFDDVAEDWNEEWEKTLFKIVWINGWQRNKLTEISRVLSLIKDNVQLLGKYTTVENGVEIEGDRFLTVLREALDLSSVTSIATADATVSSSALDDKNSNEEIYICEIRFQANVVKNTQLLDPSFDFNVKLNEKNFRDGEELKIDIELNKPIYLSIFQILPYEKKDYQVYKLFPNDFEKENFIQTKNLSLPNNIKYKIFFPPKSKKNSIDEYLLFIGSEENIDWLDKYAQIEDLKKAYIREKGLKYSYKEYTIYK